MKGMTSRQKILLGCFSMILAMIGDYLLGFGTFSTTSDPNAYMGITAKVVPDWRYALSSVLGFLCVPLFAVAVLELLKVLEKKYGLQNEKLYKLFKVADVREIPLHSRRFELEPELTTKLLKRGYKIVEIPISYNGRSYDEGKKIKPRDGLIALWTLFKYRFVD